MFDIRNFLFPIATRITPDVTPKVIETLMNRIPKYRIIIIIIKKLGFSLGRELGQWLYFIFEISL